MEDAADLPARFSPQQRTLPSMLRRQAGLHGDRTLVEIGGQTWSFTAALDMAARFGGALHAAGIGRGDHVAVMCANRAELLQVYLGCGWIGAVMVPINTASRGMQLGHVLANSEAKLLVLQAEFADAVNALDIPLPSLRAGLADRRMPDWTIAGRGPPVFPRPREPVPEAAVGPGRYCGNPVHIRHDRPFERRMLPACPVFLVGREYGTAARGARGTTCC